MARYYESIDYEVVLRIQRQRGASAVSAAVDADDLLPDRHRSGRGMTAGGSLSPSLGAVMLIPLDEAMAWLWRRCGLLYVRYMDDFVLLGRRPRTSAEGRCRFAEKFRRFSEAGGRPPAALAVCGALVWLYLDVN